MSILSKLFGRFGPDSEVSSRQSETDIRNIPKQALIVRFGYGLPSDDPFFELDEALHEAFPAEYDGHEIAMDNSDGSFYFYGPDADALLKMVAPVLLRYPFMKGASCTRRYGEADDDAAVEVSTELGAKLS